MGEEGVGTGRRGGRDWEKRGQGLGEEGVGSRIPKMERSRRKRGKLCNIVRYFAPKKAKRWEPTNTGWELGLQGTGGGRLKPSPRRCDAGPFEGYPEHYI